MDYRDCEDSLDDTALALVLGVKKYMLVGRRTALQGLFIS